MARRYSKYILILGIIAFTQYQCRAEDSNDQMKVKLKYMMQSVDSLFSQNATSEGLKLSQKARKLAIELNDADALIGIKFIRTKLFEKAGNLDSAIYTMISANRENLSLQQQHLYNNIMGVILLDLEAYSSAIPYLEELCGIGLENRPSQQDFYSLDLLGSCYMKMKDHDKTMLVFKMQSNLAQSVSNTSLYAHALNNLGYANLELNRSDLAVPFLAECINQINSLDRWGTSDSVIYLNAHENLGQAYVELKEYRKSIFYTSYYRNYNWRKTDASTHYVKATNQLGLSFLKLGAFKKVDTLIASLETRELTELEQLYLEEIRLEYFFETNQLSNYHRSAKKLEELRQRTAERKDLKIQGKVELAGMLYIENAKNAVALERSKKELIEKDNEFMYTLTWIIVVFSLIVIIALFIIFQQKRARLRVKNELLEAQKENLHYDLQLKKQDLSEFAIDMTNRTKWRTSLLEKLSSIIVQDDKGLRKGIQDLIVNTKTLVASRASTEKFQENMELVNQSFYKKILENHPDLSKYDLEFCGFIKLGMSNKDISIIKNINPTSVRMSKARVKKRLNIETDLETYLQNEF